MAKLNTQTIAITLSKLIKDTEEGSPILTDHDLAQLEAIVTELVGDKVMVEVFKEDQ
jgi:hypothetical protein